MRPAEKSFPKPVFDDEREARERQERERAEARERKRQENRQKMPTIAALFDEYNAQFPGCRIVWAIENGHVVGNPPPEAFERHKAMTEAGPTSEDQPRNG